MRRRWHKWWISCFIKQISGIWADSFLSLVSTVCSIFLPIHKREALIRFNWYFQKWQNAIFTLMDLLVQFKIMMHCVFCPSMSLMKKYTSWHGFCYLDYAYLQSYIILLLQLSFWHHNWEKTCLPGIWRKIEKISTGKWIKHTYTANFKTLHRSSKPCNVRRLNLALLC